MTKKYGKLAADDNINLSVGRGELAVLQPPCAGLILAAPDAAAQGC